MAAYKIVSDKVKVTEKTIRNWVGDFELVTIVRDSKRGKHSKTISPIVENPEFKAQFKDYVKTNSRKPGKLCQSELVPIVLTQFNHYDIFHGISMIYIFCMPC